MSLAQITWSSLLSTLIAASAPGDGGNGPMIVPDDRLVNLSVEPAPTDVTGRPRETEPPGAETALTREQQPLGVAPAEATAVTGAGGSEPPAVSPWQALDPRRSEFARVGVALAVVLGLILLLRTLGRRLAGPMAGGGRPSGVLEVLGRYPIARGQHLVLLKLAGRIVLLHQSKGNMTTLSEVSEPDEVAALLARIETATRTSGSRRFQTLLQGLGRTARAADPFPPTVDRDAAREQKVVVDLTRRPRRRSLQRGGAAT